MTEKKSLSEYVAKSKTDYKYVLKFAMHEMTDKMVDCLELCLKKYNLKSASAFRESPIQENPLDFAGVKNTPVFICDIVLDYPASLDFLRTYICNSLDISPSTLVVYSENDPRQIETDLYVERSLPEYKKNYKTRLGNEYKDTDDVTVHGAYGPEHNTKFLQELEKVRKERKIVVVDNALSPPETVDHSTLSKDYDSFNDAKNLKKDDLGLFGRVKKPNLLKTGAVK